MTQAAAWVQPIHPRKFFGTVDLALDYLVTTGSLNPIRNRNYLGLTSLPIRGTPACDNLLWE